MCAILGLYFCLSKIYLISLQDDNLNPCIERQPRKVILIAHLFQKILILHSSFLSDLKKDHWNFSNGRIFEITYSTPIMKE